MPILTPCADAGAAQAAGHLLVVAETVGCELDEEDGGRRGGWRQPLQFLERRQQAVEAEGGAHARKLLAREQLGQVVVAPPGADAADAGQVGQEGFVNGAGVIIQAASYG